MARTDASARRRATLASIDPAYLAYPLARYQRAQQRTCLVSRGVGGRRREQERSSDSGEEA